MGWRRLTGIVILAGGLLLSGFDFGTAHAAGGYGPSTVIPGSGYAITTFATGLPNSGPYGGGPVGLAFGPSGNLFVMDQFKGILYEFSASGGDASSHAINTIPIAGSPTGIAFTKDGRLYAALQVAGAVVELDPSTGSVIRTVATMCSPTGIAVDPKSGDLFVTEPTCAPNIVRISNFAHGPGTISIFSSPGEVDGITFGADGTLYATGYATGVVKIAGTASVTPAPGTVISQIIVPTADGNGIAADGSYLMVNRNDGILTKVDFGTNTAVDVANGGSRGDLATTGPDGCLYAAETDVIEKVTNADGTCSFSTVIPSPGTTTPELGSGELLATGVLPILAIALYRRRRSRHSQDDMTA